MNKLTRLAFAAALALVLPATAADQSIRNEVQRALDRGAAWMLANQNSNGWWTTADHPAVTALALTALNGDPSGRAAKAQPAAMKKGFSFLLATAQPDGGFYVRELANYNTAVTMMALLTVKDPAHDAALRKARAFLVGSQIDLGEAGRLDTPFDGGIGYGSKYKHSDLNNTLLALEAIYYSKHLIADRPAAEAKDLDWKAAIEFLQNCQNLPSHNKQPWASDAPENKGGFIYYPGHSMAGGVTNSTTGRVSLRSYGSASYAGLLSFAYADLKRGDPRVTAVLDWLRANYTLDENPGMGAQGLYYYLHTMTKALTIHGVDTFETKDGKRIAWRKEVALKLLNLQARDGSWANDNARWWEKDPVLSTAYSLIALEMIHRGL
jgi:squalene-hopene/tetraprenyl-beta-curcumene cyclase